MRLILTVMFLLFAPVVWACENTDVPGAPITTAPGASICRTGYEFLYRPEYKTPMWVAEHVEAHEVRGKTDRSDRFMTDPEFPLSQQALLSDYKGSGYARGHMAPAGNFRSDRRETDESFYLTNMVPQVQRCNNSGVWSQLEETVRDWAVHYGELYVVTGPIYEGDQSTWIGNGVRVPEGLYKVIWNPKLNETLAFVVPNKELCKTKPAMFRTSIDQVESLTGIQFFPNVETIPAGRIW